MFLDLIADISAFGDHHWDSHWPHEEAQCSMTSVPNNYSSLAT